MNWEAITRVIAIYGAFLSTFTLVWQIRRDRPKLRVRFSPQPIDPVMPVKLGFNPQGLYFLEGLNPGGRDIVVNNFGVTFPKRFQKRIHMPDKLFLLLEPRDVSWPLILAPWGKISFGVPLNALQDMITYLPVKKTRVRGFF
ncbi:MAG: hypothetical protein HPY68_09225 [Candidatus Atribacteria bacterium]|nr:hypothetical protein [Candidatus Atribacteria bacterium]